MRRTQAIFGLVLTILPAVLVSQARATTFVLMDEQALVRSSVAAVVGTVSHIESATRNATSPIFTYVFLDTESVLLGDLPAGRVVLKEPGGVVADRSEWVFGAPEYWVGERAVVFMSRNDDGTLRTTGLSMGKYSIADDAQGTAQVRREFGYGAAVLVPFDGRLTTASPRPQSLSALTQRIRTLAAAQQSSEYSSGLVVEPGEVRENIPREERAFFAFLGGPTRWFEPDVGSAVTYAIDTTGDARVGPVASRNGILSAMAAWTDVPNSSLILGDGGPTAPVPFGGCSGANRVVFNDPYNEVPNPSNCSGVLAIGGYCSSGETRVVNGTTFTRIMLGKVTFNNGWESCWFWTECNLAEVATHEIGHTIGLGHSSVSNATMAPTAHFDGRCAGLGSDDIAGVAFMYPGSSTPPTPSDTPTPRPTATVTPTATITPTPAPSNTPTSTLTRTATRTPTWTATLRPTSTPTATLTRRPTLTPTRTFTRRPTLTPTRTPTRRPTLTPTSPLAPRATLTPTRTRTATWTRLPTRTPTATWTRWPTRTPTATWTRWPTRTSTPTRTPYGYRPPTPSPTPAGVSGGAHTRQTRRDRLRAHDGE